jgi:tetratricopeptide (TPR) repeat protein
MAASKEFLASVAAGDFSKAIKALDALILEAAPGPNAAALLLNRGRCYQRLDLNRKALKARHTRHLIA